MNSPEPRRAEARKPCAGDDSRARRGFDQAFLLALVEGMRCGVLAVDSGGRLAFVNEPACKILDLEAVPASGEPIETALAMHPQLVRVIRETFSMTSLPNRAELDLEQGGGRQKTIGFTVSLVRGPTGRVSGVALFFKDLTRIEHKEEQERLRDRLAALGQMAASMAHEIRNPLAAIEVSCGLLKRRLPSDPAAARELLDKITAEVRRLNRTVNSSLEFVRPLSLVPTAHELLPLLEEAIAVARERGSRPDVSVRSRFAVAMPPFLMDRNLLRQVFVNLILNALEAVGPTGQVTVTTAVVDASRETSVPYAPAEGAARDPWQNFENFAVVRVIDDGPGIGEEARGRLFYPFFTTKKNGSGVGLSTAKKIVDGHRGLIDADNAPSGGAVFTVRLPMILETSEVAKR